MMNELTVGARLNLFSLDTLVAAKADFFPLLWKKVIIAVEMKVLNFKTSSSFQ